MYIYTQVHTYMCIYEYMNIYIYIYIYMYKYMLIYIYLYIYLCMYIYVSTYECMFVLVLSRIWWLMVPIETIEKGDLLPPWGLVEGREEASAYQHYFFKYKSPPVLRAGENRLFQLHLFVPQAAGFGWAPIQITDLKKAIWSRFEGWRKVGRRHTRVPRS
jgi:hypothetical protein